MSRFMNQVVRVLVVPLVVHRVADVVEQRRHLEPGPRRGGQPVQRASSSNKASDRPATCRAWASQKPKRAPIATASSASERSFSIDLSAPHQVDENALAQTPIDGGDAARSSAARITASSTTAPATTMSARRGSKRLRRFSESMLASASTASVDL